MKMRFADEITMAQHHIREGARQRVHQHNFLASWSHELPVG
ncbi:MULTISPECIES: hypothetical protein [unclassified Mesorhizobium]|nr:MULTISPECIES: hypothetical protein [unclassified Mesorhizobium]